MKNLKFKPIIIILIVLIVVLGTEVLKASYPKGFGNSVINTLSNLAVAVLTGLLVGVYFDYTSRGEAYDDVLKNLNISRSLSNGGIVDYFSSFNDFDFRTHLANSTSVSMYLTYGQTLFNTYNDTLLQLASTKNKVIDIFIYHEDNIFIPALNTHWNNSGSYSNTKQKVVDTKNMLVNEFSELKRKGKLKAKVNLYFMKQHPVFYSFYKFDNHILLCPSKISHDKTVKPFAFLVSNTNRADCIYSKCITELNSVLQDSNSYDVIRFEK
jgi:hypothetical protein